MSVQQGTTASGLQITVQPQNGFSGAVQVTLSGLPPGVIASPASPFTVQSGQSATLLLGASATATVGNATITAQGTSGSLSESVSLGLSVANGIAAAISRTAYTRTDAMAGMDDPAGEPHHRHLVYDLANQHIIVANRAENRLDVLSSVDGSRVATVNTAGASSADLSPDGTIIWVGTLTERIVAISTGSLQQTTTLQLTGVTPVPNTLFDRPEEVIALSGGKLLVRLREAGGAESLVALVDPTSAAVTNLTSTAPQVFQNGAGVMARSGDHSRVLVGSNDTSGEAALFDGNGNVAVAAKSLGAGQIQFAASNSNGSHFAAILTAGGNEQALLLDSGLNVVTSRTTTAARGLVFSPDGSTLYLAESPGGNVVVSALSAIDLHPIGQTQDVNLQGAGTSIEDSDSSGMVFGLVNRGVSLLDVSQPNALSVPAAEAANAPAVSPGGGPNGGGTSVTLNGENFNGPPAVRFGAQAAAGVGTSSGTQIQTTSPASALSGAVNLTAYFTGGALALAPDAFSYGPQILKILPDAGNIAGGDSIAIYGYGFGEDAGKVAVSFGTTTGTVQSVQDLGAIVPSLGLDATYPFPLQRVKVTTASGGAGSADIAITTPNGSAAARHGFQYLQSAQVFAKAGFYKFVAYDQSRQWIYLSNIDHVDVFDLTAGNFRAGILPPGGPPPNALIRQAALTPDSSQLLIADFGAQSVYVMDPDTATGTTTHVGGLAGAPDSGPVRLAATANNTVFVGMANYGGSSAGCSGCVQQMDLSASPITVGVAPQPQVSALTSAPLLDATSAGSGVFFAFPAAPGQPMATWSAGSPRQFATSLTNVVTSDVATASDGTAFASRAGSAVEIRNASLGLQSVTNTAELEGIPSRTEVPGIALHPSGALVYVPFLTGPAPITAPPFTGLQGGVDIMDANSGRLRMRIILPEPFAMLSADTDGLHGRFLAIDENGQRLFALTASGLTVIQLAQVPVGFGTITPASGSASGGETVTIRGSGFQSGTTVAIGGKPATVTFVDINTLKVTVPALSAGAQNVTITIPNGETVSVDAAFNVN